MFYRLPSSSMNHETSNCKGTELSTSGYKVQAACPCLSTQGSAVCVQVSESRVFTYLVQYVHS